MFENGNGHQIKTTRINKFDLATNETDALKSQEKYLKPKKKRCRYSDNEIDISNQKNFNQKLNEMKKNNDFNNGLTLFTKQPKTRDQQQNQYRLQFGVHNHEKKSSKSI